MQSASGECNVGNPGLTRSVQALGMILVVPDPPTRESDSWSVSGTLCNRAQETLG